MSSRTFSWLLGLTVVVATILMIAVSLALYLEAGGSPDPSRLGQMGDYKID